MKHGFVALFKKSGFMNNIFMNEIASASVYLLFSVRAKFGE